MLYFNIQSVHKVRNYFVDNGVFFLINDILYDIDICYYVTECHLLKKHRYQQNIVPDFKDTLYMAARHFFSIC